jgi:anaerobic selenocysteine-containing dehydrogenase
VALFIGKNPWHSHGLPRARVTLKEIAADPARTMIVLDPRRTETAELADVHLAVRPGTDAFLLTALLGVLVQEDLLDHAFLAAHADGLAEVTAALSKVDVGAHAARAGIPEAEARKVARVIAGARALASFEDLGVQMNHHSTLVSYLHKLLVLLTGNLGKPGTHYIPTGLIQFASGASGKKSPVAGAPIISGLVPCNVIAEEILTDHPKRYRAMLVEAANPAHSLADSPRMREALRALDTLVVIDVAMTETAELADYVLPASTQFEKAEATFFNFEFPENSFQLRPRLLRAPEGPLPEAEIHARLVMAMGALGEADLAPLREAAKLGRIAYAQALMTHVMMDARKAPLAPVLLYRTIELADDVREGAVLFGLCMKFAMEHGDSLERAGFAGSPMEAGDALFSALLERPWGVTFAKDPWTAVLERVATPNKRVQLCLPDMLAALGALADEPVPPVSDAFPFVLSAGERRSFTANTIIRDPSWRKKDGDGALRIHPEDAAELRVASGERVRITTKRGAAVVAIEISDSMQRGHVSLPNGLGLGYPGADGASTVTGVAANELTSAADRDPFVGTPWHKHVRARIERVDVAAP